MRNVSSGLDIFTDNMTESHTCGGRGVHSQGSGQRHIITRFWIGGTLRAILFGQGEPVSWFLTTGLSDASKNVLLSILYWNFRESKWGKSIWARAALWTIMHFTIMPATLMLMIVWYLPSSLWAMQATQLWLVQCPTGIIAGLAGLFASEALISYLERKRAPVAPTIS